MSKIIDIVRRVVHEENARDRGCLLGIVTTLFPHEAEDDENNYEVNVQLKHEGLELRRVPMAVSYMGMAIPPKVGDLVLVQFINGDINQPVITDRFYHDGERPPLHHQDEILFEQRVAEDGTLNHLRFTSKGTIYLQRDVTAPEDNSQALAGVKIDSEGNIEIKAGNEISITISNNHDINIAADGKPITVTCSSMSITGNVSIDGTLDVTDDTTVNTQVTVGQGPRTVITGGVIEGL